MDDDVERKGLGTPATRASMIEKLIAGGYGTRNKKQLLENEKISYATDTIELPDGGIDCSEGCNPYGFPPECAKALKDFDPAQLVESIPHFHDTEYRLKTGLPDPPPA